MMVPPTHEASPHTSVRRSPFCSTMQVHVSIEDDEDAIDATKEVKRTSEAAGMARRTSKEYTLPRVRALRRMNPLEHSAVASNHAVVRRSGVALVLMLLLPTTAAAEGLTIEDAVHLALQNNERARKAPLRVEIAEGQLDRARDAFFPTLVGPGMSTYKPDPAA